jgi:hypothetical protein
MECASNFASWNHMECASYSASWNGLAVTRVARANLANSKFARNGSSNRQNCVGPRVGVNGNIRRRSPRQVPLDRECWSCLAVGIESNPLAANYDVVGYNF